MNSISIFGVGLIGGSFALALREAGFRGEILGVSSPTTIAKACELGVIDRGSSLEEAAKADLVFLAQPISAILDTIAKLAPYIGENTIVTDAGSTKVEIVRQADRYLPAGRFVGGHPMAGKEVTGVGAAESALFRGRPWILTHSGPAADRIRPWIEAVGARPVYFEPEEHDQTVAFTSHLPQFLSTALALTLAGCSRAEDIAGPGATDMTRLALSSAALWEDIGKTNADKIDRAFDDFLFKLQDLRQAIDSKRLSEYFEAAASSAARFRES